MTDDQGAARRFGPGEGPIFPLEPTRAAALWPPPESREENRKDNRRWKSLQFAEPTH